mmetsp:Transcript_49155/g.110659  ORF Transcript_49155/g.110659 Transcript_49155/m.110659 type:complete len:338 (-) Transcript_49155:83-1096(-)
MAELHENEYVGCRYIVKYKSGKGKAGGQVYGVDDTRQSDPAKKVLKYPARREEQDALQRIYQMITKPLGLSRFFDFGTHRDARFVVMENLGRPVLEVIRGMKISLEARWSCLRILGRMLVRRLEVIHRAGILHCDVQPGNILLERQGAYETAVYWRPYLIDFGCAQILPWTNELRPDFGTVDFNSIRSSDGGPRGPSDDLESLGWVLCHGLLGDLPWFTFTKKARWSGGKLLQEDRELVCGQVKSAKLDVLYSDADVFGPEYRHMRRMPEELGNFLRLAHRGAKQGSGFPDYRALEALLGGGYFGDPMEAEKEDLEQYSKQHAKSEVAAIYLDNLLR